MNGSEFYISIPNQKNPGVLVDSSGNFTYNYKYGREAGNIQEYVKRVPFSDKTVSPEIMNRLKSTIPVTYKLIRHQEEVISGDL